MEESSWKLHTQIEIKAQEARPSIELQEDFEELKFPYFNSRSRRRRLDTWLVSVFVILHILAFIVTMVANNCSTKSHGNCTFAALGIVSFQPLSENPFLGPSSSTLDRMGAIRRTFLVENHRTWRLFTSIWLHAGTFHLLINVICITLVGIHLERELGPLRIAIIYPFSAFVGSLVCAMFVRDSPVVSSSCGLFGLLGAMLSGISRNWKYYTNKGAALALIFIVTVINFLLGLLPYVDNFSNIGAFISGLLQGYVLFFTPQLRQVAKHKGLVEFTVKGSTKPKEMLDKPVLRSVSLLLFGLLFAGCLAAVLLGIDMNQYCGWCKFVDCVPSQMWSCNDITTNCETMVSDSQMTMTCMENGNFKILPFTNISHARTMDLCTLICR